MSHNSTGPLWSLGAYELARAYQARTLSPAEVLDAILARADAINPVLNAIVTFGRDGARAAAVESERRWRASTPLGPLDGVPLTVKDNIPVRGLRATWGSRLFAEHVPDQDELVVANLRAQGAVILGKTNCPEFTLQGYTDNLLFGPTRNPWNLALTPGGSSGGAAAAVAAGLGPLAVATDGGGSIRRPASHTGLVGLKPSLDRVPRAHGFPAILHNLEVVGPIARTTADAALLFAAMTQLEARDPTSLTFTALGLETERDPPLQRILYVVRFGDAPVDQDIAESVAETADNLARLGHAITQGEAPFDLAALDRIWSVLGPAGLAWLLQDKDFGCIGAPLQQIASQGAALRAADYVDALDKVTQLSRAFAAVFTSFDVILTPSAAALPWPAEATHPDCIDGTPVGGRGHAVFTAFANAGGLSAISIPCRPSRAGLPIGFQLVGAPQADERLLQLASQYERAHPWAHRWPAIG